jgi:hypothetical protein
MTLSVATLPILAPGILEGLAARLGCSRFDAARFWLSSQNAVLPYSHQRQAAIEVRPAGAPGSGNPIEWGVSSEGLIDVTHSGVTLNGHAVEVEDGE